MISGVVLHHRYIAWPMLWRSKIGKLVASGIDLTAYRLVYPPLVLSMKTEKIREKSPQSLDVKELTGKI